MGVFCSGYHIYFNTAVLYNQTKKIDWQCLKKNQVLRILSTVQTVFVKHVDICLQIRACEHDC